MEFVEFSMYKNGDKFSTNSLSGFVETIRDHPITEGLSLTVHTASDIYRLSVDDCNAFFSRGSYQCAVSLTSSDIIRSAMLRVILEDEEYKEDWQAVLHLLSWTSAGKVLYRLGYGDNAEPTSPDETPSVITERIEDKLAVSDTVIVSFSHSGCDKVYSIVATDAESVLDFMRCTASDKVAQYRLSVPVKRPTVFVALNRRNVFVSITGELDEVLESVSLRLWKQMEFHAGQRRYKFMYSDTDTELISIDNKEPYEAGPITDIVIRETSSKFRRAELAKFHEAWKGAACDL